MRAVHSPRRIVLALTAPAVAVALAACTGGAGAPDPSTSAAPVTPPRSEAKGGTLQALSLGPVTTWDPQRISSREDEATAGRLFVRTLTAYAADPSDSGQKQLVGDLATTTGTPSADLKTWSFTLRSGVMWQDGTPMTCADIKYGISRSFATTVITGGPGYPRATLNIGKTPTGQSAYLGPYNATAANNAGKAAFDRAVVCAGNRITFKLATPISDFNEMVSLSAFAPYQAKADKRADGTHLVQSTGPYMLSGAWQPSVGGLFVRNPHWNEASDPLRKALPDQINYREGIETPQAVQDIMADGGDTTAAVSLDPAPPALQQQITAADALKGRTVNPASGLIDYLAPNWKSPVFATRAARTALALSTNRDAYVNALGGATSADAVTSLIPRSIRVGDPAVLSTTVPTAAPKPSGTATSTVTGTATGSDVAPTSTTSSSSATPSTAQTSAPSPTSSAAASTPTATGVAAASQALLRSAGLKLPVRITVAYRQGETANKAMAALAAGWRAGGFDPVLTPISKDYFTTISAPAAKSSYDVFWSNWSPEWASASTVLQPLFDSRLNLTSAGTGRDYGYVSDAAVNREMTRIATIKDPSARERAWATLDDRLTNLGAYIALAERRSMYVAGSAVRNFAGNAIAGGYVEFADIGAR